MEQHIHATPQDSYPDATPEEVNDSVAYDAEHEDYLMRTGYGWRTPGADQLTAVLVDKADPEILKDTEWEIRSGKLHGTIPDDCAELLREYWQNEEK